MSDLIKRLRGMNEYWQHAPLYNEAADTLEAKDAEIERLKNLREATEKWRIQTAEACERARDERDHYRDKYHECNAEIERLRAALEQIDEYHKAGGTQVITCARIAREALRDE